MVKSHGIIQSTPKYFGIVRTLPVKTLRHGPGETREAGSAVAAQGNRVRVLDGIKHHDPGPAPAPEPWDVCGHGRRTGGRGRASARLPPLPSSLTSSSLFSSCCSERAAESEQQQQEILYLEGEIRVLFLLSKSNLFCFAGDFTAVRLVSMLLVRRARRLLVFLTPSR